MSELSSQSIANPYLKYYLENNFWLIHGYVISEHVHIIDHIDQSGINKHGGVAEIGIEHGRFYILLNQLTESNEQSYAIDIFENQILNSNNSGNGSRQLFEQNLITSDKHKGANTTIIQGDSTDNSLNLIATIGRGKLKYVSIDGGHTAQHVVNDLKIANEIITNQGIVIVDDILHPCWMTVLEGVLAFLDTKPTLIPFAICRNKLYMCKLTYHKFYIDHMMKFPYRDKAAPTQFFGYDIVPFIFLPQEGALFYG
jgi:hypothetical protein